MGGYMDAVDKRIPVSSSVQLATIPTMDSLLVQKATEKPGKGCFEVFNFVLKFRATKAFERGVCPFQFLIHCGRVSCGPPNKRAINRALWHLKICLMKLMVQLFTPGVAANSPPITFSLKQNGKVSSRPLAMMGALSTVAWLFSTVCFQMALLQWWLLMHCCAVGLAASLQQKNSKDWYLLNPQVTGDKVNILSPKSFVHFGDWNNTKLCLMKKFGRPEYQMKQPIKMALQCSSGIWRLSPEYIWLLNTLSVGHPPLRWTLKHK